MWPCVTSLYLTGPLAGSAIGDEWRAETGLSLPVELGDQAGSLSRKTGQTGAVTLIQRFGSALNLNLHYHLLFLDGAYTQGDSHRLEFRRSRERPAVSEKRLSLTQNGQVRYELSI